MALYPGQKVICVGGDCSAQKRRWWREWARGWGVTIAKRSVTYTVRQVRLAKDGTQRIRLMEILNPIVRFKDAPDQEPWFIGWHFKPLVERQTDISVFEGMLAERRQKVDA